MIPDIAKRWFRSDFRNIATRTTRVLLVEAGPRILSRLPPDLSAAARRALTSLGVEVRLGAPVTRIDESAVWIGEERAATRAVLRAAGSIASPLGRMLGVPTDRAGRVKVEPDCSVPGHPERLVVGDLCCIERADGPPVPAVAPTANQTGAHAARIIRQTLAGKARAPFRYFHKGDLATISRHKAVAAFGKLHFGGYLVLFLSLLVYLMYLLGFHNRLSVLLPWAWASVTYQPGVRLIAGRARDALPVLGARPPHSATEERLTGTIGSR